jgi:hypothetical protein
MKSDIKIISAKPYFAEEVCRTPLKFGNVIFDKAIKDGMLSTESIKGYGLGYQIERIERDIFKE